MYNYLKKNKISLIYIPLVIYWITLFVATSIPADSLPEMFGISDKIKHFGAYLGLSVLLGLTLHFQEKLNKIAKYYLLVTFLICIAYAAIDELHQYFIPNRSCEFLDWTADFMGSFLGVIFIHFFIKFSRREFAVNSIKD